MCADSDPAQKNTAALLVATRDAVVSLLLVNHPRPGSRTTRHDHHTIATYLSYHTSNATTFLECDLAAFRLRWLASLLLTCMSSASTPPCLPAHLSYRTDHPPSMISPPSPPHSNLKACRTVRGSKFAFRATRFCDPDILLFRIDANIPSWT